MADKPFGDDYDYRVIDNRAVGKDVPFSVAMAIPIEGHLIKENNEFEAVWLHAGTVFRAYHGSFSSESRPGKAQMMQGFIQELSDIKAFIEQLGYDTHVYYPLYSKPAKKFPDANPKLNTHPTQRIYADWESSSVVAASKEGIVDQICDYKIEGHNGKTAMITHYPIDLLSQYNFGELILLESHTGSLKERSEWYSKLTLPKDIGPKIPFNILTLQVFGDKSKLFSSIKELKQKKTLLQLAEQKRWKAFTTNSKIKDDLKALDKNIADRFSRMLSIKL